MRAIYGVLTSGMLMIVSIGGLGLGRSPSVVGAREPEAECAVETGSRVEPAQVRLGEAATVTLSVRTTCQPAPDPVHVVFILDASWGSREAFDSLKAAAGAIADGLDLPRHPSTQIGVVRYAADAATLCALTNDREALRTCLAQASVGGNGRSIDAGVRDGMKVLLRGRTGFSSAEVHEVAVILSGGQNAAGCPPVLAAADAAKSQAILVATVCGPGCDEACLRVVATAPTYHHAIEDVPAMTQQLAALQAQSRQVAVRQVEVIESLPPYTRLVAGSPRPLPFEVDPAAGHISWRLRPEPSDAMTLTYRVEPLEVGTYPVSEGAQGIVLDDRGGAHAFAISPPSITVRPTVVPCNVETRAEASPATVRFGQRVDVTLFARVSCPEPEATPTHVALLLDASESMAGEPLAAARVAANRIVDLILSPDKPATAAAVVAFRDRDSIVCPLTSDAAVLHACIDGIQAGGGKALGDGIRAGLAALRGGRLPDTREVIVLMSEGPGAESCEPATGAAMEAKAEGVLLVGVCVGPTCDQTCVRDLATSPRYFFEAASAAGLIQVFERLMEECIDCCVQHQVTVVEKLVPTMPLIADSPRPRPANIDVAAATITWRSTYLPSEGITMTYSVRAAAVGETPVSAGARLQYSGICRPIGSADFPLPRVRVLPPELYLPLAAKD